MGKPTDDKQLVLDLGKSAELKTLDSFVDQQPISKEIKNSDNVVSLSDAIENRRLDKDGHTYGLILERIRHLINP